MFSLRRPKDKFLDITTDRGCNCRFPSAKNLLKHNKNFGCVWLCGSCGTTYIATPTRTTLWYGYSLADLHRDLPMTWKDHLEWRKISMHEFEELIKYR